MEKQILFADFQEQQAQDHNDLQDFMRDSIDHVVYDAITRTRRFSGFNTQKTAQTEVQVQPGRYYDVDGAIYSRSTTLVQSMVAYLPNASKRYMLLISTGVETDTDIETRDYLVDVVTEQTEPKAVATVTSRDAVLSWVTGTESSDPQVPAVPVSSVPICRVLLDTTQVVSVTMYIDFQIVSTEALDERTDTLEDFQEAIGARVSSLASDLAALAEEMRRGLRQRDIGMLYQDIARLKEIHSLPATYSDYGAEHYLDVTDSDTDNSQGFGYAATVQEGCRFPTTSAFGGNADVFEPNVFSANDPNVSIKDLPFLIPAYTDVLKLEIKPYHSDIGIAQYGFQTFNIETYDIARQRIRYGDWYLVCVNSEWWKTGTYDMIQHTFLKSGETYQWENIEGEELIIDPATDGYGQSLTHFVRMRQVWIDRWKEAYWKVTSTTNTISGAQVAQSILVPNDMWLTKIGVLCTAKAANEAIHLTLVHQTSGVPDLGKSVLHHTIAHTDIVVGSGTNIGEADEDWTIVQVQPTFLKGGTRYALVITSNANHKFAMAYGQDYIDGTFFVSTDTEYRLGDLTKDLMVRLYGAKFDAPQVTVELTALNLDGGIRGIDMLLNCIEPASTQLVFEAQPGGSGVWVPIAITSLDAFASVPPLARFRARFVGTNDMQPAILLTGSEITLFRPAMTFKHISEQQTVAAATTEVHVKVYLEGFTPGVPEGNPHACGCRIYANSQWNTAVLETDSQINALAETRYREFKFTIASTTTFTIELTGSTNTAGSTFHIAERIFWVL